MTTRDASSPDEVFELAESSRTAADDVAGDHGEKSALGTTVAAALIRGGKAVPSALSTSLRWLRKTFTEPDPVHAAKKNSSRRLTPQTVAAPEDPAVADLVNTLILDAHARGASDIHIEPRFDQCVQVRHRIDGQIKAAGELPWKFHRAVISRIKIMAVLDIAERRKPQSGKIRLNQWTDLDLELRVEIYPTIGDVEDASLRLLSPSAQRTLEKLDFSPANLAAMKALMRQPAGLFLCAGPSGSGKTTTLHGALGHIKDQNIKILTAEDPVEITQPGLRQLQVNRKAGVTFADVLRSFLRCDPDVIMIGEMRDFETASVALEASLTGHMVLSTIHTNSAVETISRLLDMGLDPYSFSDALQAVLSQRLVRTLCKACRAPSRNSATLLATLQKEYGSDTLFRTLLSQSEEELCEPRFDPCPECSGEGYRGRAAIHELLVLDESIRKQIMARNNVSQIREAAVASGMRSLKQDGIEKILAGRTTLSEVNMNCMR